MITQDIHNYLLSSCFLFIWFFIEIDFVYLSSGFVSQLSRKFLDILTFFRNIISNGQINVYGPQTMANIEPFRNYSNFRTSQTIFYKILSISKSFQNSSASFQMIFQKFLAICSSFQNNSEEILQITIIVIFIYMTMIIKFPGGS